MDYLIELSNPVCEEFPCHWILSVEDSSNLKGNGAGVVLEGSCELVLEQSLLFNF